MFSEVKNRFLVPINLAEVLAINHTDPITQPIKAKKKGMNPTRNKKKALRSHLEVTINFDIPIIHECSISNSLLVHTVFPHIVSSLE